MIRLRSGEQDTGTLDLHLSPNDTMLAHVHQNCPLTDMYSARVMGPPRNCTASRIVFSIR